MDTNRNSNNTFGHQKITSSATLSPHYTFTSNHDDMGTCEKQAIPPVPPAVPPKQSPLLVSMSENDAPEPLSAYYTPHEYIDVNGVRNKAIISVNGFEKFSHHGEHGQPPAAAKSSGRQGIYGMRRSTFVLVVALVVVAVAIGLGVGLGVGLKKAGSHGVSACPAQQSQSTTSLSPSSTTGATSATASPQPPSANGRAPTAATTTTTVTLALPNPLATGSPQSTQSKLTCPSSNSTLLTSSFSSNSQPLKYQILCDANLRASPSSPSSKRDLAGPLMAVQTLEQCWGVCDGMNFFLGRKDVAAVWNYINGPAKGDCWCVAGPQTGEGQLRVVGNEGVGVVVRPWDG